MTQPKTYWEDTKPYIFSQHLHTRDADLAGSLGSSSLTSCSQVVSRTIYSQTHSHDCQRPQVLVGWWRETSFACQVGLSIQHLTTGQPISHQGKQIRGRWGRECNMEANLLNLMLEVTSCHCHCILLFRNEPPGPAHIQGKFDKGTYFSRDHIKGGNTALASGNII